MCDDPARGRSQDTRYPRSLIRGINRVHQCKYRAQCVSVMRHPASRSTPFLSSLSLRVSNGDISVEFSCNNQSIEISLHANVTRPHREYYSFIIPTAGYVRRDSARQVRGKRADVPPSDSSGSARRQQWNQISRKKIYGSGTQLDSRCEIRSETMSMGVGVLWRVQKNMDATGWIRGHYAQLVHWRGGSVPGWYLYRRHREIKDVYRRKNPIN